MRLLRLLLVALCATAGLVVFTQVPAAACSCVVADTARQVKWADVVFVGTLTEVDQTNPGDAQVIGSTDPVFYTFDVDGSFKGDAGDGVVESERFGASCGLEGMKVGKSYVVFATENKRGGLDANLCTGTSVASDRLIGQVETAMASATEPPTPTATRVPPPAPTLPSQVPSGAEQASPEGATPAWAWFGGGVLLAMVGGAAALRLKSR